MFFSRKTRRYIALVGIICLLTACGSKEETLTEPSEEQEQAEKATFTTDNTQQPEDEQTSVSEQDDDPTRIRMIPKEQLENERATFTMDSNEESVTTGNEIASSVTPSQLKDFTLMIYMVGSSLEFDAENGCIGLGTADIAELLSAGVDYSKVNVIVYTGGALAWRFGIPSCYNCYLDLSKYNGSDNLRTCIATNTVGDSNTGATDTFAEFLNFCNENYPAKEYGLVCWDHGGGPLNGFGADMRHGGDSLTLSEMKTALMKSPFSGDKKLSFVGFDACLMGSVENALVWKDYADYLVASEETEPGTGWDYTCFNCLNSFSDIKDALEIITRESIETMSESNGVVTLSVMDLSKVEPLVNSLNSLFGVMLNDIKAGNNATVQRIRYNSRDFGRSGEEYQHYDLVDIYDFADKLTSLYAGDANKVKDCVEQFIVTQHTNIKDAHGVTIFYPSSQLPYYEEYISANYKNVALSSDYFSYLESYYDIWQNGSVQNDSETASSEEATAQQIQDMIAFQLTQSQNDSFVSGYFNVYERVWNDEYLTPVMLNCKIEPDENGTILVPYNPELLCATSDELEREVLWMVRQTEEYDDHKVYESLSSALTPGGDFYDIGVSDTYVTIKIDVDNSGEASIVSITPNQGNSYSNAKAEIDLKKWDSVSQTFSSLLPVINDDGATLPASAWDSTGWMGQLLAVDKEFGFEVKNADEIDAELVCQVVIKDKNGNTGTSGLVPLKEYNANIYSYSTNNGEMLFAISGDTAVLKKYEGDEETIEIPQSIDGKAVKVIGSYAFSNAANLKEVILPEGIETIEASAFSNRQNLQHIELPSSLKTIKAYAFDNCKSLTNISLPENVEWIGKSAFSDCESLESITLPSSLSRIGRSAFTNCTKLQKIELSGENSACKMEANVLLSKDGKTVLAVPAGASTFVKIPEGVETIGYGAFAGCSQLKKVELPSSLKTIENFAFYDCTGLVGLDLPDGLEWLGTKAFGWNRENITPGLQQSLFGTAEDERNEIESISLGSKVKYIGNNAFGAFKTGEINVSSNNTEYASVDGFLTNGARDYILQAPSNLSGSVVIPDCIGGIADGVFYHNEEITDFYIPVSVTSISDDTFCYKYGDNSEKIYSITIHGSAGSVAEKFANEHNISFVAE